MLSECSKRPAARELAERIARPVEVGLPGARPPVALRNGAALQSQRGGRGDSEFTDVRFGC